MLVHGSYIVQPALHIDIPIYQYLWYILVPHGHPQNVTAVNKTSTSILITWDEVPRGERKGHIEKYKVNYTSARNNVTKSKEVRAQSLEIVNLQANTNYTITVSASTVKGYGPASQPIVVATDQDSKSLAFLYWKGLCFHFYVFPNSLQYIYIYI